MVVFYLLHHHRFCWQMEIGWYCLSIMTWKLDILSCNLFYYKGHRAFIVFCLDIDVKVLIHLEDRKDRYVQILKDSADSNGAVDI